ncbi:MAG: hypothetical protein ABIQ44_11865 [Chloroflexia bacterium]
MNANAMSDRTVTASFDKPEAAQSAIAELRNRGIPESSITLTVQGWDANENTTAAMSSSEGVARRELGTSNTVRVSPELPNDEDLPTTEAYMTDSPVSERNVTVLMDPDIPPDEPMGGGLRMGIDKTGYNEVQPAEYDMIRRSDANADADVDIYTDFPDQPGGLSPDSPLSGGGDADRGTDEGHSANSGLPPGEGHAATITVTVDDFQWEQVSGILESHGGHLTT